MCDPAASAISIYVGYSFKSMLPIFASEELFVSYQNLQFGPWLAWYDLG
jgi:hypothetical protein